MEDSLKYYLFYCAVIKSIYPNVVWGINGQFDDLKSIYFEFRLNDLENIEIIKNKICSFRFDKSVKLNIKKEKLKLKEYLNLLKKENQDYKYDLLLNYLTYSKYINYDKDEYKYLKKLFYENTEFEMLKDYYLKHTLINAQYSFSKLEEILKQPITNTWSTDQNILLTFLFIQLYSLFKNTKKNSTYKNETTNIIDSVEINHYDRYCRNKPKPVKNIDEAIQHYRDVFCHKQEADSSNISCKVDSASGVIHMTRNIKNNPVFIYGGGSLNLLQIKNLIKDFAIMFVGEIEVIYLEDTSRNLTLFLDLFNIFHSFSNVPIKNDFSIEYNTDKNFYRFLIPTAYF